jgi:hypothetical protein
VTTSDVTTSDVTTSEEPKMNVADLFVENFISSALARVPWATVALEKWTDIAPFHEPTALARDAGGRVRLVGDLQEE